MNMIFFMIMVNAIQHLFCETLTLYAITRFQLLHQVKLVRT